jgi:hypothetical protein
MLILTYSLRSPQAVRHGSVPISTCTYGIRAARVGGAWIPAGDVAVLGRRSEDSLYVLN